MLPDRPPSELARPSHPAQAAPLISSDEAMRRLAGIFGSEQRQSHLLRWPIDRSGARILDLWLDPTRPGPVEVWLSRPSDDRPYRCDVGTGEELEHLISGVLALMSSTDPVDLNSLCRGLTAERQEGLLLRWRRAGGGAK